MELNSECELNVKFHDNINIYVWSHFLFVLIGIRSKSNVSLVKRCYVMFLKEECKQKNDLKKKKT